MSWYVEELFLNREFIRAKGDVDSDEFEDLLVVEAVLDMLVDLDQINRSQKKRFERFLVTRKKEFDILHFVCKKIADYLQDKYTDEGYLEYMKDKYKLNEDQVDTIRAYMASHLQHKLINRPFVKENFSKNVKKIN